MDIKNFDFNKFENRFLSMITGSEDMLVKSINNVNPVVRNWYNYHRKKWIELVCAYDFNYDFTFIKVKKSRLTSPKSYYDFRTKTWIIQFEDVVKNETIYDTSMRFGRLINEILLVHNFVMSSDKYGFLHIELSALKFGIDTFSGNFDYIKFINDIQNPETKKLLLKFFNNSYFVENFGDMSMEDVLNWVQYFMNDEEEDDDNGSNSMEDRDPE